MEQIEKVHAREVLDSRGNPTVEVEVVLASKAKSRSIVPSGASTGVHEAIELRDNDENRYGGKGVLKAVSNVNTIIADVVEGMDPSHQEDIDRKMIEADGTKNKKKLGANAILGVSMAVAHSASSSKNMHLFQHFSNIAKKGFSTTLPTPMMNVINGGVHADSGLDIQEFMIVPTGAKSFSEALQMGTEIFHTLKKILKNKGLAISVGDEGGFAPKLSKNTEAIDLILKAVKEAGYEGKIEIALDVAASEFYDAESQKYTFDGKKITAKQLISFYEKLVAKYPIASIEDPFDQDDFEAWKDFTAKMGDKIQIVGDDLLVTNPEKIKEAIEGKWANSVLIKLNQIGTVSETIDAILMAQKAGWTTVISHRSGETEDTTIADLAVGLNAGQIKTGSLCRSERICKYNQLLRIEEYLSGKAGYQGKIR